MLPPWANEMRDLFRAGAVAQFIIHGNIFDVVPAGGKLYPLKRFMEEAMFEGYDVVLTYDRGPRHPGREGRRRLGRVAAQCGGERSQHAWPSFGSPGRRWS